MFGSIGVPELLIVMMVSCLWLVPIIAVVWVIVTLSRIRSGQQAIETRLAQIEQRLQRP